MSRNRYLFDPLRRGVLVGLLSSVAGAALAGAPLVSVRPAPRPLSVGRKVARMAADRLIGRSRITGRVTFALADADTGEILAAREPLLGLPTASVAKTATSLYALDVLGPRHRFQTRVVASGPLEDGVVKGDLVLLGGGDPLMDTDTLAALVDEMTARGVKSVEGRFLVDATALPEVAEIDPAQPVQVGYNPSVSGLNLNFNRVHFGWTRRGAGYDLRLDARARRHRPEVSFARMQVVNRSRPIFTYEGDSRQGNWTVARYALGKGGGRWLPVRLPGVYAGEVFHTLAKVAGVVLPEPETGTAPAYRLLLAQHSGAELEDVLRGMLKYSTNLTAEALGLAATRARGLPGATLAESAGAMSDWLHHRYGVRHAHFVDHSGLGGETRVSARAMVRILGRAGWDGRLRPLLKPLRFTDSRGRTIRNHALTASAKTGTLNFVSTLAGYVTTPGGRRLVFAIFVADLDKRAAVAPADRERPRGSRQWNTRAKRLQQRLIQSWADIFDV